MTNGEDNLLVDRDDPRYLSGEYWFLHKDKFVAVDKEGNKFMVSRDDPRYLSSELESIFKGKVTVRSKKDGRCYNIDRKDYDKNSDEYEQNTKGTTPVKLEDGTYVRLSVDDPDVISGKYEHNCKGKVTIWDQDKGKIS